MTPSYDWDEPWAAAILETDRSKLKGRIDAAHAATIQRTQFQVSREYHESSQGRIPSIYVEQRLVRAKELSTLVEKALDGSGESFRLKFDDGSNLYLSTKSGILTATVSK